MVLKPCAQPLCPNFAEVRGRCAEHATQYRSATRARTLGRKLYDSKRWKALRRKILLRDRYTCQECKRFGNEVDHIVPLAQGGDIWSEDNLQTLCKSCHSTKTAKETWA